MNKDAEFNLTVNDNDELIEISTEISFSGDYVVKYADDLPHIAKHNVIADKGGIRCPACGSDDLTTISETYTVGKDFNRSNACCGYFLCGPLGLLYGVDKKGKQQHTNNFFGFAKIAEINSECNVKSVYKKILKLIFLIVTKFGKKLFLLQGINFLYVQDARGFC